MGVNFEARFKTKVKGSGEGMSHLLSGSGQEEESRRKCISANFIALYVLFTAPINFLYLKNKYDNANFITCTALEFRVYGVRTACQLLRRQSQAITRVS